MLEVWVRENSSARKLLRPWKRPRLETRNTPSCFHILLGPPKGWSPFRRRISNLTPISHYLLVLSHPQEYHETCRSNPLHSPSLKQPLTQLTTFKTLNARIIQSGFGEVQPTGSWRSSTQELMFQVLTTKSVHDGDKDKDSCDSTHLTTLSSPKLHQWAPHPRYLLLSQRFPQ